MYLHAYFIYIPLIRMPHILTSAYMHSDSVKVSRDGTAAAGDARWDSAGSVDSCWEEGSWASIDYARYVPCAQVSSTMLMHHQGMNDAEET